MPAGLSNAGTTGKPALEPVPRDGCRICTAATRGRSAARINGNSGGVKQYSAIIEAHPHRGDQAEDERQGDDDQTDTGEESPLMATLRERVTEENGLRREFRARVGP
ncbi:hypothetical protein ABZ383_02440 [Streptomyces sp. NPDC005900]|uniref:hypothetical protein n=1 Tax=unclassified Streptomyces TaxID=2593676 RepID=UPI0034011569